MSVEEKAYINKIEIFDVKFEVKRGNFNVYDLVIDFKMRNNSDKAVEELMLRSQSCQ